MILLLFRKRETIFLKNRLLKFNSRLFGKCIILLGVLTGLFFSAGEGIRLMPFPAAAFSFNVPVQIGSPAASYQYAVQRLNGSSFKTRKTKRSNDGAAGDHVAAPADATILDLSSFLFSGLFLSPERVAIFTPFVGTHSGRGPPAI
jgi:hypothetical protein